MPSQHDTGCTCHHRHLSLPCLLPSVLPPVAASSTPSHDKFDDSPERRADAAAPALVPRPQSVHLFSLSSSPFGSQKGFFGIHIILKTLDIIISSPFGSQKGFFGIHIILETIDIII